MKQSTGIIIGIVILAAVIILVSVFTSGSKNQNAPVNQPSADSGSTQATTPAAPQNQTEQTIITYTDEGFSPLSLTVASGTTVTFKNQSSNPMWPASALHPTHGVYPTTGGCIGSTFDACRGIAPGESWSFKFDIAGTWKYHDHLNASKTGTIIVAPLQ